MKKQQFNKKNQEPKQAQDHPWLPIYSYVWHLLLCMYASLLSSRVPRTRNKQKNLNCQTPIKTNQQTATSLLAVSMSCLRMATLAHNSISVAGSWTSNMFPSLLNIYMRKSSKIIKQLPPMSYKPSLKQLSSPLGCYWGTNCCFFCT